MADYLVEVFNPTNPDQVARRHLMNAKETCKWYISEDQPECGEPATDVVSVRGKITRGSIPVCKKHKAEHNESFARLRTGSK